MPATTIFSEYEARLRMLNRHNRTIYNFRRAATLLDEWLSERGLTFEQLKRRELEEYFATSGLKPSTQGIHLVQIRAAANYALRDGVIGRDPTLDVQIQREADVEPRIIPNPELRAIKKRARTEREELTITLLAYTGMRRNEVRCLKWEDVSLRDRTITVMGKGSKLRKVPIHPAVRKLLKEVARRGPFVLQGRNQHIAETTWIETLRKIAPGYSAHDFRRTVATSLRRNGVPAEVVDRIGGWAPRGVRERYYIHVADSELVEGICKLYADDPV